MVFFDFSYIVVLSANLAGTLIIEMFLAWILGVRKKNLELVFLVNCITNMIVVTIAYLIDWAPRRMGYYFSLTGGVPPFLLLTFHAIVIAMEIAVVIVEWRVYEKAKLKCRVSPFVLSLILNAASYGAGILLDHYKLGV